MTPITYTYADLGARKDHILDVCKRVAAQNPTAWRQAHNGEWNDTSARFNDLCVQALRAEGIYAGRNGKRGGSQLSDDVLCFGLQAGEGGAADKGGRFAEIAIIDFINGAGGPTPSVGWNDVSSSSPGRFADPEGLASIDGAQPPPVSVETPGTPVTPAPAPVIDISPLVALISALASRLLVIEKAIADAVTRNEVLTDLTANRIVANRVEVQEQLSALQDHLDKQRKCRFL